MQGESKKKMRKEVKRVLSPSSLTSKRWSGMGEEREREAGRTKDINRFVMLDGVFNLRFDTVHGIGACPQVKERCQWCILSKRERRERRRRRKRRRTKKEKEKEKEIVKRNHTKKQEKREKTNINFHNNDPIIIISINITLYVMYYVLVMLLESRG